jgi:hypothetical protein
MFFPLSRGNCIQWQLNNKKIYIYDHSYNSGASSLLTMMENTHGVGGVKVFVFTPLKECANPQEVFDTISNLTHKNNLIGKVYDPNGELIDYPWDNFSSQDDLLKNLINFISLQTEDVHVFIKGANSFKMIKIVGGLIQWLGNFR